MRLLDLFPHAKIKFDLEDCDRMTVELLLRNIRDLDGSAQRLLGSAMGGR